MNNLHLRVAREEKIPMVIATCWGDNGAEASHFSVLPTLQQYAEYCYAKGEDAAWVKTRFYETFRVPFDEFLLLDSPNRLSDIDPHDCSKFAAKALLYNDPLAGWMDSQVRESYRREYEEKERALAGLPDTPFRYLFHTAQQLCRVLALKATLSLDIRKAYRAGDREALRAIAEERIPAALTALDGYLEAAREEWYHDNKTFGFDVIELRIGGLKERLRTARRVLEDYTEGSLDRIELLEEPLLEAAPVNNAWTQLSTGSIHY